ncbi:molybdopterin oxidoreductase family protein [Knoellia sp. LjRoot47]|uniref:molybdopterin oxidoreductase family protein n=1 Tax=Knoellia sp. LjRoot47 TaxID=3342330 RepID=UPI003ECEDC90
MTDVATHCPYCALQCAQTLTPGPSGVGVAGRDFPTNRGGLCQKGWTSASVLRAPDRLTTPLVRGASGELEPTSWEAALDLVALRLSEIRAAHGADAVAVFGGGGLTNEKAYQLGKFARIALGTANIDYNGRFCMSSAAAAANRSLGVDRGLPFPLTDVGGAQAVLLLGSNLAETMPPAVAHLSGARAAGGLVVVDPRVSTTATLTDDGAGVHLQPVPGTDLVVLLGLLHVVFAEGLDDTAYIASRTTGVEDARRLAAAWWPERVEQVAGVPAGRLRETARLLAVASPSRGGAGAYVLTGRGVEQSTQGTAAVNAAINLALALGLPGRVGSGYGAVTGQGNGQGGREHGQKSDQLPGYRMIDDPEARAHVAAVWGVAREVIPGKGKPAVELLDSLGREDGPKAMLVHGANLRVSTPNSRHVGERLDALDLLVVCDVVPSETAQRADVVLPVLQWAEEEGTMTSLEGRVLRRRRAVDAPDGARSELWVWRELATRLGSPGTWDTDAALVFDELARASAGGRADYSGLSHARLDAEPDLFWPCPATDGEPHPGTPRLFLDTFPTVDGRARFVAVDDHGPDDDVRSDAPVHLVTGRVLQHYQSGAQTRRVDELVVASPEAFVEIHPVLADRHDITSGDDVTLTSARGTVTAPARVTDRVRPDTVFMPFHWAGDASVNRVTNDATDPVSGMPEFKVCAVSVCRADPQPTQDPPRHRSDTEVPA